MCLLEYPCMGKIILPECNTRACILIEMCLVAYASPKNMSLDLKENAQEFIQTNERRQAFLGKYKLTN